MPPFPSRTVFTVAELTTLGWTRSAIRNAVRTGRFARVRFGVYSSDPLAAHIHTVAAAHAYPQATVSHRSALLVHGLPLLGGRPATPELTVPPRASITMPGVHPHRARISATDRTVIQQAAVTTVARTLVDVARTRPVDTGVAAMDAALHRDLVTPGEIEWVLLECWNWPGIRQAQHVFELSDARAESPLESVSRLAFPRLGLPAPRPQVDIFDEDGTFLGRSDFYWDAVGVVGEADGMLKYRDPGDPDALVREKERQEALERTGLAVARWGWAEAWRRQSALRTRILAAFERAQARDHAGLPRRWVARDAAAVAEPR